MAHNLINNMEDYHALRRDFSICVLSYHIKISTMYMYLILHVQWDLLLTRDQQWFKCPNNPYIIIVIIRSSDRFTIIISITTRNYAKMIFYKSRGWFYYVKVHVPSSLYSSVNVSQIVSRCWSLEQALWLYIHNI